jgi:phosphotransferase system  glucose/maltose/N-acetylglucosamine-specific IIC component
MDLIRRLGKTEIRNLLAVCSLLGCLTLIGLMQVHPVPEQNKDILNIAIGFLFGSCLSPVFQFFFGASKTENDKNHKPHE